MFERFTDRARRVVVLAQEEARLLDHSYIGTEHILLGLIHESEGIAAKVLVFEGVTLEGIREQVTEIIGQAGSYSPSGHIPFTPRAKKVLELSLREALQLGHNYIGTEHILLGLIREGEGVAAQVLAGLGIELDKTRYDVIQALSGNPVVLPVTVSSGAVTITAPMSFLESLAGYSAWYEASATNYEVFLAADHPVRVLYDELLHILPSSTRSGGSEEGSSTEQDEVGVGTYGGTPPRVATGTDD